MSKILIVEDNAESRYMLERLLSSKGHHVIAAENGDEALKLTRQDPPEIIISDIMMPVMNGFKLCRKIKSDPDLRHIPFIFYTATFVEKTDEELAMSLGASRFVVKPTEGEAFLEILNEVLKEHQKGALPVPEGPLEDEEILLEMYDNALARKLAQTVEKLQRERHALLRSERRLKEAQELAQIGHWELDLRSDSLEWSDEIYRILGVTPGAFDPSYKTLMTMELIHPDDRAFVTRTHKESLSKKTPCDIEYRVLLEDGTIKYLNEKFQTLCDEQGVPVCSMGTVQDITDRKEAERAQRESEARYQVLFKEALDGICIADADTGVIIDCNRALAALVGRDRTALIGQPQSILHPFNESTDILSPTFREHLTVKEGQTVETQVVTGKGETREVEIKANRVDLLGRKAMQGIFRDISDRKQAEHALKESEEKYRLLIENAGEVILVAQEGKVKFLNQRIFELLGYEPKEVIGKAFTEFIHAEDRQFVAERHLRRMKGEDLPHVYPFRVTDKSGETRWVEINAIRIDWEGKPATLNFLTDISERKEAEKALKEANDIINKSSSVAFTWKKQEGWPVEFVSENVARVFGYSAEEFMSGRISYSDCIHPEDLPRVSEEVADVARNPEISEFDHEPYRIIGKDGTEKIVSDWTYMVRDSEGSVICYKGIVEDISESTRSEEERESLQKQLYQAQKMESVGRLAGGVAHDFNNMLSVIQGRSELALLDMDPKDPLRASLEEISRAANRSSKIIRQLLAFARKQTIAPEVLDLNENVEGMLKMLRRLIGEDIDLSWHPDTNLWPVNMDPVQIDQILANLCVNARDAISGVGKISIETENMALKEADCQSHPDFLPGEYVLLTVSDDGMGMDRETLGNVFEPFFTTKEVGKGTGLGLSTVYGIVTQNQGFIDMMSEPGRGTTARIHLPRHQGESKEEIKEAKLEIPRGHGETILIVEDEAVVLDVGKEILERLGYTVLAISNPNEALELARSYSSDIDLLMTDVVMPGMSGMELVEEVKKVRPKLQTLFMSGYTADIITRQGVLEKGVHFIQKPFKPDILARKLREVLGK